MDREGTNGMKIDPGGKLRIPSDEYQR